MGILEIALLVGALGAGIYQTTAQQSSQRQAIRRQQAAQEQAKANALGQQRRADEQERRLNRQTPDIGSLLAYEQQFKPFGGTAQKPVDQSKLTLGRPSLLGQP